MTFLFLNTLLDEVWDQVRFKEILFFFQYTKVVLLFKHKPVKIFLFGFLKELENKLIYLWIKFKKTTSSKFFVVFSWSLIILSCFSNCRKSFLRQWKMNDINIKSLGKQCFPRTKYLGFYVEFFIVFKVCFGISGCIQLRFSVSY